jgi:hypothetical protein
MAGLFFEPIRLRSVSAIRLTQALVLPVARHLARDVVRKGVSRRDTPLPFVPRREGEFAADHECDGLALHLDDLAHLAAGSCVALSNPYRAGVDGHSLRALAQKNPAAAVCATGRELVLRIDRIASQPALAASHYRMLT